MEPEGNLKQIRLQCPRRITNWEPQQHLKDNLFHWICKYIRDSIQYFYSNPWTTYYQLMIAAHKAKSKNEKACNKVRARSAMTTEPVEGSPESGNQIAKLMAALARAGQGNSPGSAPNSHRQRGHGRGWMDRNMPGHPNSHNGQTGLGQTSLAHSISAGHIHGPQVKARGPKIAKEAPQIGRIPVPSNASGAKVGATWFGNVPPQWRL